MIASVAMMLNYSFNLSQEAEAIERAIQTVLEQGYRTKDIEAPGTTLVGTEKMGQLILQFVQDA